MHAGGQYYKGEVVNVRQKQPSHGASLAEREAYDPWEALDVEWEMGGALEAEEGGCLRVSPWEIEGDPETEAQLAEEFRKQEEASARAARALAKSRRCSRLIIRLVHESFSPSMSMSMHMSHHTAHEASVPGMSMLMMHIHCMP